jgi:hypothetical protein
MIEILKRKHTYDVYEFLNRTYDRYQEFYVTFDKERKYLRSNLKLITKMLKHQEIYALRNKTIDGLLMIYRTKGFRPYIKLLAKDHKSYQSLLQYIDWTFYKEELFLKLKSNNPLVKEFLDKIVEKDKPTQYKSKSNFIFIGLRGNELLLKKYKDWKKALVITKDETC